MKVVVATQEAIRIAEHDCSAAADPWFEAYQWLDEYCPKNRLAVVDKHIGTDLLYVWVKKV
jgi:hypothetical protein